MSMSGADADQLELVGIEMERAGRRLGRNGKALQRSLNSSPWSGRNADRFRAEYNSVHLRAIADAATFLDGLYEELARQAQQQRDASGVGDPGWTDRIALQIRRWIGSWVDRIGWLPGWIDRLPWHGFPIVPIFPWFWRGRPGRFPHLPPGWWLPPVAPFQPRDWWKDFITPMPGPIPFPVPWGPREPRDAIPHPPGDLHRGPFPPPDRPDGPGARSGELMAPRSDAEAQRVHDTHQPGLIRGFQYQCVAWAKARWIELGVPPGKLQRGHGWNLAGANGGVVGGEPTLGAMASYGSEADYGHVMIVEQIDLNGDGPTRIRVSEMNTGSDGSSAAVGNPSEYRDDRWWVQQSDGTWRRETEGNGAKTLTFAKVPL
jgi:surface antigen